MNWRPQNARMRARSLGAVGWSCDRRSLYYIVCDYIFSIPHIHTFNGAWSISTARATASSRRHSLTLCNIYFSRPTIILCILLLCDAHSREGIRWWKMMAIRMHHFMGDTSLGLFRWTHLRVECLRVCLFSGPQYDYRVTTLHCGLCGPNVLFNKIAGSASRW